MTHSRNFLLAALAASCLPVYVSAQRSFALRSPDGRIEVKVRAAERITYDVAVRGRPLVQGATASIQIGQTQLGLGVKVQASGERSVDRVIEPQVRQKFARIRENYNELRLKLDGGLAMAFRAYNEGVAYRLETTLAQPRVKVYSEEANFNFPGDYTVYFPAEESFFSHNERSYAPRKLSSIPLGTLGTLPAVVDVDGVKVAIAESDVEDYPGLWLRGTGANGLTSSFPPYPLKETLVTSLDYRVSEAAGYIADTRGSRTFPWRILAIAETDGALITNQLVWLLAKPTQVEDASWIKPGKAAWDWWNASNLYGVDFRSGINTQTYQYYIDFASRHAIEYIIIDAGWYQRDNVLQPVPDMNIEDLVAYGRRKNVGIILWAGWKSLASQLQPALDQFGKWGIRGIKVDFMQRDDQRLINFYHDLSREAAKRKLLVDFHGAQRPALMTRTWPNLISTEGVKGMEWSKWSAETDPAHTVMLPFTRMLLGPMDFTPGAMLNATRRDFAAINHRPMSLGTRCHQLAMYVVYESPLQMLADSPSNYLREPEAMEFLGPVPSVWDDTIVLEARMGEFAVVARRHDRQWYIGAMTNWLPRELEISLSFLPAGGFRMMAFQDGVNANRMASDYKLVRSQVNSGTTLKIRLAEGGGWAARIEP